MRAWILVIGGIFTIIASQSDWEWYWKLGRAQMWIDWFGEDGAKTALTIGGVLLTIAGLLFMASGTGD